MMAMLVAPAFGATSTAATTLRFRTTGLVANQATSSTAALTVALGPLTIDTATGTATQTTLAIGNSRVAAATGATSTSGRRLSQATSTSTAETAFRFRTTGLVAVNAASSTNSFALSFPGLVNVAGSNAQAAIFTVAVGPTAFAGATRATSTSTAGRKLSQAGSTATADTFATFRTTGLAIVQQSSAANTFTITQPGVVTLTGGASRAAVLTIAVGPTRAAAATRATSTSTTGRKLSAVSAGVDVTATAAFQSAQNQFGAAFSNVKTVSTAFTVGAGTAFPVNVAVAAGAGVAVAITGPRLG